MSTMMLFAGQAMAEEVTINFDDDYATLFPTLPGTSSGSGATAVTDGDFTETTTSTAVSGITVTVSPADEGKTANRIWNASPRLRVYSGTLTVSGTDITKIVFDAPSKFNLSTSTGTLDGKTWTGDKTNEVVFTVGGNSQIKSIVVTLGEGGDTPGPVDPGVVTKAASIEALIGMGDTENVELTLTNAKVVFNDGNSIYVRENGKAVCFYQVDAVKNLFKDNAIVSGTIILDYLMYQSLMPEVKSNNNTSASALTVTESEEAAAPIETTLARVDAGEHAADLVKVTGKLVREVTYKEDGVTVSTTNYFLEDGDAKVKVANNSKNLPKLVDEGVETIIVTGVVNTFSGAYQIKLIKNAEDPNNPDTPEPPVTETDINVAKALEIIAGLEDGKTTSQTYNVKGYVVGTPDFQRKTDGSLYGNVNFTMGDNASATDLLTVYRAKYFGNVAFTEETISSLKAGDEVIVTGKLQKYVKDGVASSQLTSGYITSINGKTTPDVPEVEPTKVGSIADLLKMENTTNIELTLTNAKVLFNDGNNIYVRENDKALCFYKVDAIKDLFKDNAVINGTIRVDYELLSNLLPEVKANAYTNASTLNVVESEEEAAPVSTTLSRVDEGEHAADLITLTATLVRVVKFKVDKETGEIAKDKEGNPVAGTTEYYLDDEEVRIKVANNAKNLGELAEAGVTEVSETEKVSTKENITVTGIVNIYSNAYQIKLTKNAEDGAEGIPGDVNGDGTVDVADISAIISVMAGTTTYAHADVNGDGTVDVADISNVISIMAGGQ